MGTFENVGERLDDATDDTARAGRRIARRTRNASDGISSDLRTLLRDLDDSLSDGSDTDVAALRERVRARLADAQDLFDDTQQSIKERLDEAIATTDDYVRNRPWETVGAVAGIAFLFGIIIGRS
ncbi:MAG: DUF883 family protein [Janthinobacterium lividum]